MRINLDEQFLNLYGEPLEGEKMADVLAALLAEASTDDPEKMHSWAVNLANEGCVNINAEDAKLLISFIKYSPNLKNLAKAQLIERIKKAIEHEKVS